MLIPAHPCDKFELRMMAQSQHSPAQFHKDYFRELPREETSQQVNSCQLSYRDSTFSIFFCQVLGRDIKPTVGMKVRLTDAGKEYVRLYDAKYGTTMLDEGIGTVVANGRSSYSGMVSTR